MSLQLTKGVLFTILSGAAAMPAFGKTVYIPLYLQHTSPNDGARFSYSKTAQSANFILIWGHTVGTNPAAYTRDPALAFLPSRLPDTLEYLNTAYKSSGFPDDAPGDASVSI